MSAGVPSPAKTRSNRSLIAARRAADNGANASARSGPAKHELRLASSAHDMFTGHGVIWPRYIGLLAMRAAGGANLRTAAHNSGDCANISPPGRGSPVKL